MKVSNLIKEIEASASLHFRIYNLNDWVSVATSYYSHNDSWACWLFRPTEDQLSRGAFYPDTVKLEEVRVALFTPGSSLIDALKNLRLRLNDIEPSDHKHFY